jgi:DNA-binding transcriptional LysR family regulator
VVKAYLSAEQKKYFSTLGKIGSISKAADTLYLSRQGLSKSIRSIEEHLGVKLFRRDANGVTLTQSGQRLLECIHQEEQLWDECLAEIQACASVEPELIRVGLLSMYFGYQQKSTLLASFRDNPCVRIQIIDGDHDYFWRLITKTSYIKSRDKIQKL